jgi:hypothetical protein
MCINFRSGWDLAERLDRLTANAESGNCPRFDPIIPASSDTGRQMKQWC